MKKYLILLMLGLAACSNSQQEEETARLKRQEAEIEQTRTRQEAERTKVQEEQKPEEPAAPPEPETIDVYKVVLSSGTKLTCKDIDETACGYKLEQCDDGFEYRCVTNMKYQTVQVLKPAE